ncbi:FHA domain-containing protein [Umezawaea sp. NPDC059074]|uniref:FHA domain-containing protein n=1 Tax=Umezawaea sp. NPDC059074 TaxID=3346716 RepID=UPI0036983D50
MGTPLGMYRLGPSTPSLLRHEPLLNGSQAPADTAFVLGEDGGYGAAPAPANRLVLGRNSPDVHITVGIGDWYVSREHATLRYAAGRGWTLRNNGKLPIRVPDLPPVLKEHETALPPGYTPLYIQGSRVHVIELLISGGRGRQEESRPAAATRDMSWPLTDRERLVLVALFQDFLLRVDGAHPLSWNRTSQVLGEVPGQSRWTDRKAENVVDGVRRKLAQGGVDGVTSASAHPEAIKRNLLRTLLDTATLVPPDLRLLETGIGGTAS